VYYPPKDDTIEYGGRELTREQFLDIRIGWPRVYLASSCRNPRHDEVVAALTAAGIKFYNYREPEPGVAGFSWREIEEGWAEWSVEQYRAALEEHPAAERAFGRDMSGLTWADTILAVLPSGFSVGWELGYSRAAGKRCVVLLGDGQFDLMIRGCVLVTTVEAAIAEVLK
jgi:hypothetical protein